MDRPDPSPGKLRQPLPGLMIGLAGAGLIAGVRLLMEPLVGGRAAFSFFFPWIILVGWVWGLRATIGTSIASLLLGWYLFIPEQFTFPLRDIRDATALSINALSMVVCGLVGAMGRRARLSERQAMERVRESESRFRAAFEHAPIGVVELDLETNEILRLNHEYARILGRDPAEVVGKPPRDFTHPDDLGADDAAQQVAMERRPIRRHKRYVRPDGSTVWVEIRANVVHEGGPPRLLGLVKDVTEEFRVQEQLRESETQVREMTDAIPALISYIDRGLVYRFANATYLRWFGLTREQLIGRTMGEVLGPEALATLRPHIDRALAGESVRFEAPAPYRHGPARWIEAYYEPRFDDAGRVMGLYVMVLEISARKLAELAQTESEDRFRTLADNMSQLAWMTDGTGSITWYNKRWFDYTGTTFEEMQGWGWTKVHHPDHIESVLEHFRHSINSGEEWEDLFPLRGRDGEYRWFLSRAVPIRDEQGAIVRWFGTNTDITEQRETEEKLLAMTTELARHKEQLEALVSERTAALERSHEQLRRSERMASLGTFAAGLGHDLHNSLLPLRVHIEELARASREVPSIAENVHAIEAIVGYLGSLSRGMRLFSRDVNQDTDRAETDLSEWRLDACRFFQSSVPREVRVTCDIEGGLPRVAVAPHRLSQAVLNLVTNAGDAILAARGPGGTGTIAIRAEKAAGGMVSLRVTDDGIGMTEHVRQRAIEPYFTTKARGQGGTGMGLAMVFGIVSNAGGSVEIRSKPGEGTAIELLLPAAKPQEAGPGHSFAHVTLQNRRVAAYVAVVLQALGMRAVHHAPDSSDASDLWVTDAATTPPARVRTFLESHPGGKVVVIGGTGEHAREGAHTAPAELPLSGLRTTIVSAAGAEG